MKKPVTPLVRAHDEACRLGDEGRPRAALARHDLLFGIHALKFPIIAVTVSNELGNCRHALAQRAVAGTMEVSLPFGDSNPFFRTPRSAGLSPQPTGSSQSD